jgi:hypothetical protein
MRSLIIEKFDERYFGILSAAGRGIFQRNVITLFFGKGI